MLTAVARASPYQAFNPRREPAAVARSSVDEVTRAPCRMSGRGEYHKLTLGPNRKAPRDDLSPPDLSRVDGPQPDEAQDLVDPFDDEERAATAAA